MFQQNKSMKTSDWWSHPADGFYSYNVEDCDEHLMLWTWVCSRCRVSLLQVQQNICDSSDESNICAPHRLKELKSFIFHPNCSNLGLFEVDSGTCSAHFSSAESWSSASVLWRIVIKSARSETWQCVCECVCLRSHAVCFQMSGLDWFLLPLINSSCTLMLCIENCWMAFSEIKTTNSAFHNLTGDWREADSCLIASLGDFFLIGELSTHQLFLFSIHVGWVRSCCSACQNI